jgi:CubicO group peptidase (beta-lactamase class C family)
MVSAAVLLAVQDEKKKESPGIQEQLDKLFFEWNRMDRPGGAVVVVKDGKVLFKKAYGRASMEHNIPNTTGTLYEAVTVSAPVTAMAIAMLEAQGKLSLEDNIRKHISELPDWGKTVTLAHLLNHTSGIRDWSKALLAAGMRQDDVITFDHIMKMVKRQQQLVFEPGSKYDYSHTDYNLLAEIVARVTGQTFREWTWANIFRPLGMKRTLFRDRFGEPVENQAYAYDYSRMRGYRRGGDNLGAVGSHGLYSSVEDMSKWLLNLETGTVGGKTVIEKMLRPGTLNNGKTIDFACGFNIASYKGLKSYSVSGRWGGFNSALQYFPEQKFAVLLLCNWVSGWINPVSTARNITGIYLKAHFKEDPGSTATPAKTGKIKIDPALYDEYVGDYRWNSGYLFKIVKEKDKLYYQLYPSRKYLLSPQTNTRFLLSAGVNYQFIFKRNKAGKVHQLLVQGGGEPDDIAKKIKLVRSTPGELKEFEGTYHSRELGSTYSVSVKDKSLSITHRRLDDLRLTPEEQDCFRTNSRIFTRVEFLRDKQQKISGFKLGGLDVVFRKTIN